MRRPWDGVAPKRSSTCPSGFPCGATGSGVPPTAIAEPFAGASLVAPLIGVVPRPFLFRMPPLSPSTLRDGPRPDTVSRRTESLVASVAQHHRAISAHQSQLLAAVVELDRRKAWRVDGATSMGGGA